MGVSTDRIKTGEVDTVITTAGMDLDIRTHQVLFYGEGGAADATTNSELLITKARTMDQETI